MIPKSLVTVHVCVHVCEGVGVGVGACVKLTCSTMSLGKWSSLSIVRTMRLISLLDSFNLDKRMVQF